MQLTEEVESDHPASRKTGNGNYKEIRDDLGPEDDNPGDNLKMLNKAPADFSDDEENDTAENRMFNKQALLEWLTVADFTKEVQLHKIAGHKFRLDNEERDAVIENEGILKICKV